MRTRPPPRLSSEFDMQGADACAHVKRAPGPGRPRFRRCGEVAVCQITDETGAAHFLCASCYRRIAALHLNFSPSS
jgi:hypothetical protein